MLEHITPIILSHNEEANLERTLSALRWAREIVVIDSISDDDTLKICAEFSNVRVIQNTFVSFADQCNFALGQQIKTAWVLSMDADYIVTPELQEELSTLAPGKEVQGFRIQFEYLIKGRALKGSLYPPRTCLYRRASAQYQQDGHAHRVVIDGEVSTLTHKMQHDDRKPYARWYASQKKYARQEANKLANTRWQDLSWPDRCRYWGIAPLLVIPYTLFAKALITNGWAGLQYAWQRFIAEVLLQLARFKLVTKTITK